MKTRHAIMVVLILLTAATAQASTLTLYYSGSIDLSGAGGPANSQYSGFFTWDPAKLPLQPDPNTPAYLVESYQLNLNGVNKTLGPGNAGLVVMNDGDLEGGPGNNDGLLFLGRLDDNVTINGVTGHTLLVLGFVGGTSFWNTISLPTDYSFLSLPTRLSLVSLEVSGGADVIVGEGGPFVATPTVPEPASLTLLGTGVVTLVGRRLRRRRPTPHASE